MIFKQETIDEDFFNKPDIIKLITDVKITDKNGNIIEIKVPRPEYRSEIFL